MVKSIIVIASGPSLTQNQVDTAKASGLPIMVINDNYKLVPEAEFLFAADLQWWYHNYYIVPETISCYTLDRHIEHLERRIGGCSDRLKGVSFTHDREELDLDDEIIHHGSNSGYMGLQLAVILGYTKLIMIGFDHQHTNGMRHWFGDHDSKIFKVNADHVDKWVDSIDGLVYYMTHKGIDIVNCSNETAIRTIRRSTLEDELNENQSK